MSNIQSIWFIFIFLSIFSLSIFIKSLIKVAKHKKAFEKTPFLFFLGIFVWGDGVILGLFWFFVSLLCFILKDYLLFLLITSLFWLIRSIGEVIYWLNQQFSPINRNLPEKLFGYFIFKNDSIWFAYQLFWQCVFILSAIATFYFINLWFKTLK